MKSRINVITLAVADLERSLAFYRDGLGLESQGVVATELLDDHTGASGDIVIFNLEGGLFLCPYPRSELAKDAGVPLGASKSGEFSIGHAVVSRAEVEEVLARAEAAGAKVDDKPHDRPWGIYSGYFLDPDGHLWEVMHNPSLELAPGG